MGTITRKIIKRIHQKMFQTLLSFIYLLVVFIMMAIMSWCIAPFVTYNSNYADKVRALLRLHVKLVLKSNKEGKQHGSFSGMDSGK